MKTRFKFKKLITNTLIAIFILTASSELIAQEKKSDNLNSFKVVVEKTDNGIKMQSAEGRGLIYLLVSVTTDHKQLTNME